MIEFIKKHSKLYMILSMCILVGTIGITYAFYSATVTDNTKVVGQAGGGSLPTLTIGKITTDSGKLIPIDMNTEMLTKAASASPKCIDKNGHTACQIYSVTVTNNTDVGQSFNVELTSLSGTNTPNVDAVSMGTSNSSVANATSIKDNGLICTTNRVNKGETTNTCYFMVLIKNINSAQTDNGIFNGTVTITSTTGAELKADFSNGEKLTTTILNLYNKASKSPISAADGLTYNYASSVSLMNDRLADSTVGIDEGNIRYYGLSPDNYVDIGDRTSDNKVIPYRIIGLFKNVTLSDGTTKDLVKVIRNEPIGKYSWDTSASSINSGSGINEWSQADLMKLLNPGYTGTGGSLWWDSKSGNCYSSSNNTTTSCNFTSTGLSSNVQSKIEEVIWNLGGCNSTSIFTNQIYSYERQGNVIQNPSDGITRKITWPGKVALAYPSDYGYAVDLSSCKNQLNKYNNSSCTSVNWMHNPMTSTANSPSWLLTPRSSNADLAWYVGSDGYVRHNTGVNYSYGVSPVFYLDSELTVESGSGKSDDLYVLG